MAGVRRLIRHKRVTAHGVAVVSHTVVAHVGTSILHLLILLFILVAEALIILIVIVAAVILLLLLVPRHFVAIVSLIVVILPLPIILLLLLVSSYLLLFRIYSWYFVGFLFFGLRVLLVGVLKLFVEFLLGPFDELLFHEFLLL